MEGKCRFGASPFSCVSGMLYLEITKSDLPAIVSYENGSIKTKRKVCLCLKTHLFFCFLLFQNRVLLFVFKALFLHQLAVAPLLDFCIAQTARLVDFIL